MTDQPTDHYAAALTAFESANKQMGPTVMPELKPLATALATVGVGHAILALVDELRRQNT